MKIDLKPDALFGLTYEDCSTIFYFVEADRDTEGGRTYGQKRKDFFRTLLMYYQLIGKGQYKTDLRVKSRPRCSMSLSLSHMEYLIDITKTYSKNHKNSTHLFQTAQGFSKPFKPPHVLKQLYEGGWKRTGYPDFYIDKNPATSS